MGLNTRELRVGYDRFLILEPLFLGYEYSE